MQHANNKPLKKVRPAISSSYKSIRMESNVPLPVTGIALFSIFKELSNKLSSFKSEKSDCVHLFSDKKAPQNFDKLYGNIGVNL